MRARPVSPWEINRVGDVFHKTLKQPDGSLYFYVVSIGHSFTGYHDREESTGRCINGRAAEKSLPRESNALKIAKKTQRHVGRILHGCAVAKLLEVN